MLGKIANLGAVFRSDVECASIQPRWHELGKPTSSEFGMVEPNLPDYVFPDFIECRWHDFQNA
jgi:hypothetical protein